MRLALIVALAATAASAAPGEVVRVEHRDPTALPTKGPANALVTVELFFTPWSGSRSGWYSLVQKLQAAHPSRVRLVYRILRSSGSATLHFAALEAHAQGKFFELMDKLNAEKAAPNLSKLLELGKAVGMDTAQLRAALTHPPAGYDKVLEDTKRRYNLRFGNANPPNVLFNGRPPATTLNTITQTDLEREYLAAKDFAEELLDRGADPAQLAAAVDAESRPPIQDPNVPIGDVDEPIDNLPLDPPLATPPLRLEGLPSLGPADAQVTIVVLCSPKSAKCRVPMSTARNVRDNYPDSVRVVWGPYYDLENEDAANLSLLGDAALCAEKVGASTNDSPEAASSGWKWVEKMREEATGHHRRVSAEEQIDKLAETLKIDHRAFATCRARTAGSTVSFVEAARHAGVRTAPTTIVGGRIYMSALSDPAILSKLVEAELAPGALGEWAPAWRRSLGAR